MAAKPRVGMVGKGNVGQALQKGLARAGYEVRATGKEPAKVAEVGAWAEVLVLAVPHWELDSALRELGGAARGKVLLDVTNALTPEGKFASSPEESGAERLQKKASDAKVVKAFNTTFAETMETGKVKGLALTLFVAGDDADAKRRVLEMGRDIGFDAVDAGPLANARWLEALGYLNIQLGYTLKMGTHQGFRLVR